MAKRSLDLSLITLPCSTSSSADGVGGGDAADETQSPGTVVVRREFVVVEGRRFALHHVFVVATFSRRMIRREAPSRISGRDRRGGAVRAVGRRRSNSQKKK